MTTGSDENKKARMSFADICYDMDTATPEDVAFALRVPIEYVRDLIKDGTVTERADGSLSWEEVGYAVAEAGNQDKKHHKDLDDWLGQCHRVVPGRSWLLPKHFAPEMAKRGYSYKVVRVMPHAWENTHLSLEEAADFLGVSLKGLETAIADGQLKSMSGGGGGFYRWELLEYKAEWLEPSKAEE